MFLFVDIYENHEGRFEVLYKALRIQQGHISNIELDKTLEEKSLSIQLKKRKMN